MRVKIEVDALLCLIKSSEEMGRQSAILQEKVDPGPALDEGQVYGFGGKLLYRLPFENYERLLADMDRLVAERDTLLREREKAREQLEVSESQRRMAVSLRNDMQHRVEKADAERDRAMKEHAQALQWAREARESCIAANEKAADFEQRLAAAERRNRKGK